MSPGLPGLSECKVSHSRGKETGSFLEYSMPIGMWSSLTSQSRIDHARKDSLLLLLLPVGLEWCSRVPRRCSRFFHAKLPSCQFSRRKDREWERERARVRVQRVTKQRHFWMFLCLFVISDPFICVPTVVCLGTGWSCCRASPWSHRYRSSTRSRTDVSASCLGPGCGPASGEWCCAYGWTGWCTSCFDWWIFTD